ncbi:MAG: hypothetical protein ABI844_18285 [Saprospiraceae bacterium]
MNLYTIFIKRIGYSFILFACILCFPENTIGQTSSIHLNESAVITRLNNYFIEYNMRTSEFQGWRVQVFVSTDRREMENILASFKNKFPGYAAKWALNDPYYQVRAGIFIEYSEAMNALHEIRKSFRSATLFVDRIKKEEILAR